MSSKRAGYLYIIVACLLLALHIPQVSLEIPDTNQLLLLSMMMCFLYITHRFPMTVGRVYISLDLLIVFLFYIHLGFTAACILISVILITINVVHKKNVHSILVNMAMYIISLGAAHGGLALTFSHIPQGLPEWIAHLALFLFMFMIVNNVLVDVLFYLRKEPYTWADWVLKSKLIVITFLFSLGYGVLFHILGTLEQNGDAFAYIFFLLPLVASSVISHIIVKLSEEKQKMRTLLFASQKMNESIETEDVLDGIQEAMKQVMDKTFGAIYMKRGQHMHPERLWGYRQGAYRGTYSIISEQMIRNVQKQRETVYVKNLKALQLNIRHKEFKRSSVLAVPIILGGEVIGGMVVGCEGSRGFMEADKTILQTLANQASIAIKNCRLVQEKKKRILMEERNRLAREIHDGIAQSIAAITMQVETTHRLLPPKANHLRKKLDTILFGLRTSLKEIRHSIYALRPSPTDSLGLQGAVRKKTEEFEHSTGITCQFRAKGSEPRLSKMLEEAIYQIVSEALQNIYKHAYATEAMVLIHYFTDHIDVFVRDDGIGFALAEVLQNDLSEKSFGILNMNELAHKWQGSFEVNSSKGKGTEIHVSIPLIETEEDEEDEHSNRVS